MPSKESEQVLPSSLLAARNIRIPCKARGLKDHNSETAYFQIPAINPPHGLLLVCSHIECANTDRRFRYCAVCRLPCSKRNFSKRHDHGLLERADGRAVFPTDECNTCGGACSCRSENADGGTDTGDEESIHPGRPATKRQRVENEIEDNSCEPSSYCCPRKSMVVPSSILIPAICITEEAASCERGRGRAMHGECELSSGEREWLELYRSRPRKTMAHQTEESNRWAKSIIKAIGDAAVPFVKEAALEFSATSLNTGDGGQREGIVGETLEDDLCFFLERFQD